MKKKLLLLVVVLLIVPLNLLIVFKPSPAYAKPSCVEIDMYYPNGFIDQFFYCWRCYQSGGPEQMAQSCIAVGGFGCVSSHCLDTPGE